MNNLGYDVQNYTDMDPLLGTIEDFDEFLDEMNKRGLKVLINFVINHNSEQHPCFKKSINRIEPYTDFYVWANPEGYHENETPIPSNNWVTHHYL
ncbi:hypothetical protein V9T40_000169 [Parthenolecanium corni]|uniref:alpha-glucosidase n=1 Tax=Parthenolecanium corni TaxID=536013 RepID=A0AAN9TDV5_9HEMI